MKNRDKNTKLPLFENIDCIHIRVADLDSGLEFYQNALGLNLLWRTKHACWLGMKTGDTEIVISKEDYLMVDVKVENVEKALTTLGAAEFVVNALGGLTHRVCGIGPVLLLDPRLVLHGVGIEQDQNRGQKQERVQDRLKRLFRLFHLTPAHTASSGQGQ